MLGIGAQFGIGDHATPTNLLDPLIALVVAGVAGAALILVLQRTVPPLRRTIRTRAHRRRRLQAMAGTELRARVQMDELCPHGWQARITVFSSTGDLPTEAPNPERVRVALDWAPRSADASAETVLVRRIWAESINGALEAMVADRITDETLQQIELQALADGAEWPDQYL